MMATIGKCRICETPSGNSIFSALLLDQDVSYYECLACGYVQTQEPTWLDRAYEDVINKSDTGIMQRNQNNVGIVLATLAIIGKRDGRVVDSAGGYGILVRLLRDAGVDALWSDPYCTNLLAIGFEHSTQDADIVTAFEAFEHFVDPISEAERLFATAPNLLISTLVIPSPTPTPDNWWYYGMDHGQHIGFFRLKTLDFMARRFRKHLITDGQCYHFFSDSAVSPAWWRIRCALTRRFPRLFTAGLQSRVWSDFQKMSDAG